MAEAPTPERIRRTARRMVQLVWLSLIFLLAVLWGGVTAHLAFEKRLSAETALDRDRNLATMVDHYAVRVFRNAEAVNQFVASTLRPGLPDAELQDTVDRRAAANDALAEVAVCLGDRIVSSQVQPALTPALCGVLRSALEQQEARLVAGPVVTARGQPFVPLASLGRQERLQGHVVVSFVRPATLLGVLESSSFRDTALVALLEGRDRVIASWDMQQGFTLAPAPALALVRALPSAESGAGFVVVDGQRVLATARTVPQYPLRVVLGTPEREILAGYWQRRTASLGGAALLSMLFVSLAVLLHRQTLRNAQLAVSLHEAQDRLTALNQGLEAQVRERTSALEQANKDLESFSYTVAHDVRAPLAAIQGFAQVLAPAVAASSNPKHAHYLDRILANAAQMGRLTEQLLALAKLKRATLQLEPVDLSALAREIADGLREREPQRNVEVAIAPAPPVRADAVLVRQVLENLLGNAFKFSGRRERAEIAFGVLAHAHGQATFYVRDNGAGFDTREATGLFEPFRRLHATSDFPGTGVGLATTARILALHGGAVWAEAEPDRGATFYFRLPTAASGTIRSPSASGSTP